LAVSFADIFSSVCYFKNVCDL